VSINTAAVREPEIVARAADYLGRVYNTRATVCDPLPLSVIPARARRVHPSWGIPQILSGYVIDHVLAPRLPGDAAAMIGFTASDLWPGEGWNFVFGEASLRRRTGVWSIYRYGNPDDGPGAYRRCLLRAIKVAAHESGHMFSMEHCTAYLCGMNGSNSLGETDRQPLWFCPECEAKVCWASKDDPAARFERLAAFCEANQLTVEAEFFRRSAAALR